MRRFTAATAVVVLGCLGFFLTIHPVLVTGEINLESSQIPVLIAAIVFGPWAGIGAALIAGAGAFLDPVTLRATTVAVVHLSLIHI